MSVPPLRKQIAIALVAGALGLAVLLTVVFAAGRRSAAETPRRTVSTNADRFPLSKADPTGHRLLSRAGVIASLGWTGKRVGAVELTYRQAASNYPRLAAASSVIIDPSRKVWVLTYHYDKPVRIPAAGPPGLRVRDATMSAMTEIVDAQTGEATDWCEGCAYVPAQKH